MRSRSKSISCRRSVVTETVAGNQSDPQGDKSSVGAAQTLRDTESAESKKQAGMIFPWPQLVKICTALQGPDAMNFTRKMIGKMFSDSFRAANQEWIVAENLKFPRRHAAHLLFNGALHD